MTSLTTLPPEILSLIVSKVDHKDLYAVTQVNRQLFEVTTPLLWIFIHTLNRTFGLRFLYCLVFARPSVAALIRSVHLENFDGWTDRILMILMRRLPNLTSLTLAQGGRITDQVMQQVPLFWPQLESLTLTWCSITHVSYLALGRCKKLTHLGLMHCRGLRPDTLSVCFAETPLQSLELAPWIGDNDDEQEDAWLVDDASTLCLDGLSLLTRLKIIGGPFGVIQKMMDQGVAFHWPWLTRLELEECFDLVNDEDAVRLIRGFSTSGGGGLTRLTLKDGTFRSFVLHLIAKYHPNLVALDVSYNNHLTSHSIRHLIHRCRYLSMIKLSYCGMTMMDFPQAGPQCASTVVMFNGTFTGLDHLDSESIEGIRRE